MGKLALVAKITHVPSMYLSELDGPQKAHASQLLMGISKSESAAGNWVSIPSLFLIRIGW